MKQALAARRDIARFKKLKQRDVVFFSEDAASYSHLGPLVEQTAAQHGEVLYLASEFDDPVLTQPAPGVVPFFVGTGIQRTSLFMAMDAKVVVMTMPDLETFYLKRSKVASPHYAYVFHSMVSTHMIYREGAFDHFDSILCVGPHHQAEIRATEKAYGLGEKKLIPHGYGKLDSMRQAVRTAPTRETGRRVLVAPSWGEHGLFEKHGATLIETLAGGNFEVVLRPHPMTGKKWPAVTKLLQSAAAQHANITLETDVGAFDSFMASDVMISDWSGAALEYAFAFEKPVVFIDVPRKINNRNYERIDIDPVEVSLRAELGAVVSPTELANLTDVLGQAIAEPATFVERMQQARDRTVYNVDSSATVGAQALIELLG